MFQWSRMRVCPTLKEIWSYNRCVDCILIIEAGNNAQARGDLTAQLLTQQTPSHARINSGVSFIGKDPDKHLLQ